MSPPSRLLPEVSGFTTSFIGGSEVGRAGRGWDWNGGLTAASRWIGGVLSYGMEWNVQSTAQSPCPSPDADTHPPAACLPPSLTDRAGHPTCRPEVGPFQGSLRPGPAPFPGGSSLPPSSPRTHRKQLLPGILGLVEQLSPALPAAIPALWPSPPWGRPASRPLWVNCPWDWAGRQLGAEPENQTAGWQEEVLPSAEACRPGPTPATEIQ